MKFTYKRRVYIYQDNEVRTEKGNLARDQDKLRGVAKRYYASVDARGFHLGMSFDELEQYVGILNTEAKEELFHQIYEAYLYVNDIVGEKDQKLSQQEFFKCMAKLKRYENYLYIIIKS